MGHLVASAQHPAATDCVIVADMAPLKALWYPHAQVSAALGGLALAQQFAHPPLAMARAPRVIFAPLAPALLQMRRAMLGDGAQRAKQLQHAAGHAMLATFALCQQRPPPMRRAQRALTVQQQGSLLPRARGCAALGTMAQAQRRRLLPVAGLYLVDISQLRAPLQQQGRGRAQRAIMV